MWQSWTPKYHSRPPREVALPWDSVPTMVMTKASVDPVVRKGARSTNSIISGKFRQGRIVSRHHSNAGKRCRSALAATPPVRAPLWKMPGLLSTQSGFCPILPPYPHHPEPKIIRLWRGRDWNCPQSHSHELIVYCSLIKNFIQCLTGSTLFQLGSKIFFSLVAMTHETLVLDVCSRFASTTFYPGVLPAVYIKGS